MYRSHTSLIARSFVSRLFKTSLVLLTLSAGIFAQTPCPGGTPGFASPLTVPVGSAPKFPAIADFDNDGKNDVAVPSLNDGIVAIRKGNGDGTFTALNNIFVDYNTHEVKAGDLNKDGNMDLVAASSWSGAHVLLGDGTGNFTPAGAFNGPPQTLAVEIADFNEDGNPDVAFVPNDGGYVSVLLGNGTGSFTGPQTYWVGVRVHGMAVADLDNDGHIDIAVPNQTAQTITFKFGDGTGAFPRTTIFPTGRYNTDIVAVDLDRDGNMDLASSNGPGTMSAFLGNGDGTFSIMPAVPSGYNLYGVAAGDFNGDDIPDVVTANMGASDQAPWFAAVHIGRGNGTFDPAIFLEVGNSPVAAESGDLNGDGQDDLIVVSTNVNQFYVFLTALHRDTTPPEIGAVSDVYVYLPVGVNAPYPVTFDLPSATDSCGDAVVSADPPSGSLFELGTTAVTVTATDSYGNAATIGFNVHVLYPWSGIFAPVESLPVVNIAKAGQAVPLTFSLEGYRGTGILAAGYPASGTAACQAYEPADVLEETFSAGGSSLAYDPITGNYTYVWKTSKAWRNTCRMFALRLADGTDHYLKFSFR